MKRPNSLINRRLDYMLVPSREELTKNLGKNDDFLLLVDEPSLEHLRIEILNPSSVGTLIDLTIEYTYFPYFVIADKKDAKLEIREQALRQLDKLNGYVDQAVIKQDSSILRQFERIFLDTYMDIYDNNFEINSLGVESFKTSISQHKTAGGHAIQLAEIVAEKRGESLSKFELGEHGVLLYYLAKHGFFHEQSYSRIINMWSILAGKSGLKNFTKEAKDGLESNSLYERPLPNKLRRHHLTSIRDFCQKVIEDIDENKVTIPKS